VSYVSRLRLVGQLAKRWRLRTPDLASHEGSVNWGLISSLEKSERFRRDGALGGIFHPGRLSYRELCPRDSLHISIDGDRVSVHVDDVCPLRCGPDAPEGYSWPRVLTHNLAGLRGDISRRLRGLHGMQRCNLGCEMVWVDDDGAIADLAATVEHDPSSVHHSCSEDEV
jgi:hypothetical protein